MKRTHHRNCRSRGLQHVFRFIRYASEFDYTVHPWSKERKPKWGTFRCTECGAEITTPIRHRP